MAKKEKRFRKVHAESVGFGEDLIVLVDTRTGVNYVFYHYGNGGGLTPLLDRDGKPLITSTLDIEE